MEKKSELNDLFRTRLTDAKMTVREGFWEELQRDAVGTDFMSVHSTTHKWWGYRVAAAAAVLLLLGAASAAFWYFSPKEEIKEAFTKVEGDKAFMDGRQQGDKAFTDSSQQDSDPQPLIASSPKIKTSSPRHLVASSPDDDDETLSVHVSITITERVQGGGGYTPHGGYQTAADTYNGTTTADTAPSLPASQPKPRNWAIKAGIGTSLPKGDCDVPFTAAVSVERRLGRRFSVEAGLSYHCLSGTPTLHTLEVPLRVNLLLASSRKVDLYALAGGAAEKCIAGATDNSFGAEPVQLSVAAGLGVRYRLGDRLSLFAEPTVSHHFDTDSKTRSLRSERPTNLNLLCGLRMTY